MNFQESALSLAEKGFHVFRLRPNSKLPFASGWQKEATRNPEKIRKLWGDNASFNVGVFTGKFGDNESLLVVDVDNKEGKNGSEEIVKLELEGFNFPSTYKVRTPTGGEHLYYRVSEAVKQGSSVLAQGLDVRSRGGYVVGSGSVLEGSYYHEECGDIEVCPEWIASKCGRYQAVPESAKEEYKIDPQLAKERAEFYLKNEAQLAIQGAAGDETTYKVACRVKDFGVKKEVCFDLMADFWNPRCQPPWSENDLSAKVSNAYRYGALAPGSSSPEAVFDEVTDEKKAPELSPLEKLNQKYAFLIVGGHSTIIREEGNAVKYLSVQAFHELHAPKRMQVGERTRGVSHVWMEWKHRRTYHGLCFNPLKPTSPELYNLWKGFSVELPKDGQLITAQAKESVSAFLMHAKENVCGGNKELFNWLMGFFAHMIQKPWEKPLVALVFRGSKGVGKSALIERVGSLVRSHYKVTSDRRYLLGNFNSHLEHLLLFALEEAFWSGDKQAEGTLKQLITGDTLLIERKGKEPYVGQNKMRVVIIGNEEWLIPASHDERRFAVFDVGEGNKQDKEFFHDMRVGLEAGGYSLLLDYFQRFDLSTVDVNEAPETQALLDQKISTLPPFYQWWHECIMNEKLIGSEFNEEWPIEVDKEVFRIAFQKYARDQKITSRLPAERMIGKLLVKCLGINPAFRKREGKQFVWCYKLPRIEQAKKAWQEFIGHDGGFEH